MPDNQINEKLVSRLKRGDIAAFDEIYKCYCLRLFSFVLKILKNKYDAEEIVQEVFLKFWESRHKLDDCNAVNGYVFTMAYNASIDFIRKKINERKYFEQLKYSATINTLTYPAHESYELINEAAYLIARLPERQKQIFLMHREQGLTYGEIADKLGISKNTVENHMVRALKQLRSTIDRWNV